MCATINKIREDLKTQADPVVRNMGEAIIAGHDRAKGNARREIARRLRKIVRDYEGSDWNVTLLGEHVEAIESAIDVLWPQADGQSCIDRDAELDEAR